jgi:uncharacterized surface protein with fasciclin (FAS1) repeats
MKKRITTIAILAASAVLATTGVASAASGAPEVRQDKNIVQVASGAPQFSTLVSLIKKAGLVKTLSGKGPFTVLAPTNAAFNKVPKDTLNAIAADKNLLTKVLTYHVIAGEVPAAEVVKLNGKKVKTVEGSKVTITVRDGKVYVNKTAKVTATDIEASNGVIHAINNVLVPQSVLTALSH